MLIVSCTIYPYFYVLTFFDTARRSDNLEKKLKQMKNPGLLVVSLFLVFSCTIEHRTVFIEAEAFEEKGGWLVDPQFVEQMGSPYLLAHGMGEPVVPAETRLTIPKAALYHIWVRTINWASGQWEAPGRFKLEVDGQELETILGTETGWNWQYAGFVSLAEKDIEVKLIDLTGFDGRCDAICFSTEKKAPPNQSEDLTRWRKEQLNEADTPERKLNFDLVVVGGGIAGCATAIAAAEEGLNIALIHDRAVLGGNASSEIRVHTEGITWLYNRILSMINTVHYPNGSPESIQDDKKRHKNIAKYENINLFLNHRAHAVNTNHESITSVDARHTSSGERIRFNAPLFVDCTGDGWIGYWAGAEYMYGREDSSLYHENWGKHGELWSPAETDNRVMGTSVLWRSADAGKSIDFPEVPWAMDVAKSHDATNGEWHWEFSRNDLHQIEDAEEIRDHMLKAIYGSFYNAKQKPENANLYLEWVSYLTGKRESRRLVGDYIYTFNDARQMTEFGDAVVMEKRVIDVHFQQNLIDSTKPDFLSEALYYPVDHYYIPYRSLYSKNIKNLFMAGRCFSCSHVGLGGPRVMHTTGQMGAAVGYAASICSKHNTIPRKVYENHLEELKSLIKNSNTKTIGQQHYKISNARIPVCVDPRIELFSTIHRLAGTGQYDENQLPHYIADVEAWFGPFREHEAVQLAIRLRETHNLDGNSPMALAVYLNDPPALEGRAALNPTPSDLDPRWTAEVIPLFLEAARKFAIDTDFKRFFESHRLLYDQAVLNLQKTLEGKDILAWFEEYFGYQPDSYVIILGLQNGSCNYGSSVTFEDGRREFQSILGASRPDNSGAPQYPSDWYIPTIVHEFCHSYINPLVDQYREVLRESGELIFPAHKEKLSQSGYNHWYVMMYEYLTRACVIRYLTTVEGVHAASQQMKWDERYGFPAINGLVDLLNDYENNRDTYPQMEAFMPQIAAFFNQIGKTDK